MKMTVSLGPQGTLVTGTKTKTVTAKSISEMRVVNRSVLVTSIYGVRYLVGKFVTGVPMEARYSVVSVCNEL
jgi:hypothetical protein